MRKTKVGNFIVIIIFKFNELVAAWLQREWEKKNITSRKVQIFSELGFGVAVSLILVKPFIR